MNSGKGNRIVLCMGVVALAGVLSNGKTGMAVTKENPLITEAYKYIQGMEGIETRVLQNRAKARVALLGSEEAPEESLVLFSRTKGLEGTRVYANVNNYVNINEDYCRIVYESYTDGSIVQDVPVSFSQLHRKHSYRKKKEEICYMKSDNETVITEHDPMAEL